MFLFLFLFSLMHIWSLSGVGCIQGTDFPSIFPSNHLPPRTVPFVTSLSFAAIIGLFKMLYTNLGVNVAKRFISMLEAPLIGSWSNSHRERKVKMGFSSAWHNWVCMFMCKCVLLSLPQRDNVFVGWHFHILNPCAVVSFSSRIAEIVGYACVPCCTIWNGTRTCLQKVNDKIVLLFICSTTHNC